MPPAEVSVGVCSILKPGKSILAFCECFEEILLFELKFLNHRYLVKWKKCPNEK